MDNLTLQYIAGFFDGEGCIGVYKRNKNKAGDKFYFVLVVSVSQGGKEGRRILEKIKGKFGGSISTKNSVNKQMWQWSVSADKALFFLERLGPLLILKYEQAMTALLFQKLINKTANSEEAIKLANHLKYLKTI